MWQFELARSRPLSCLLGWALVIASLMRPAHLHAQSYSASGFARDFASAAVSPSPDTQPYASVRPNSRNPSGSASPIAAPTAPLCAPPAAPAPPKTLGQSLVEGVPAFIGILLTACLGWFVGQGITARWDILKKRTEINLQLSQELNKVIAEFKTVGREREALKIRTAQVTTKAAWDEIETTRLGLVSRAIAAESGLEALLLKMIGDMETSLSHMSPTRAASERDRQLAIMGLTRVAFRQAREVLAEGKLEAPGYGEVRVWLFNRLAADLTDILASRTTLPRQCSFWALWARHGDAPSATESYLRVIAYRTIDLQMAEAAMLDASRAYQVQRNAARMERWRDNARRFFRADKIVIFTSTQNGASPQIDGQDDPTRPVVIYLVDMAKTRSLTSVGDTFFQERSDLRWFVVLAGGGARMLLKHRNGSMEILHESDPLPAGFLTDAGVDHVEGSPLPTAIALLGWHQAQAAKADLASMADVDIVGI